MKVTKNQLRKIIREEVKKVIAEGTRALIGVEAPNGSITSFYTHYDGYPEHTGKMLKKYYSNSGIIKKLMKLGKNGVSFLDKSIKGGKDHSFNSPKDGETIFYGRDRGEKGNMVAKARNRERMMAYKEAQRQYTREVKLKK